MNQNLAVFLAVLVIVAIAAITRRPLRRPRPRPGEIWFVNFPYADDWTKSKDRPALVVSIGNQTAVVRKITSQDQSRRPDEYDAVPRGYGGLAKAGWIKRAPDNVALRHFRRKIGAVGQHRSRRAA